jgi:uncharacterized integral membrane protein
MPDRRKVGVEVVVRHAWIWALGVVALLAVVAGAWWINRDIDQKAMELEEKWSKMSDEEVLVDGLRRVNKLNVSMGGEDITADINDVERSFQEQGEAWTEDELLAVEQQLLLEEQQLGRGNRVKPVATPVARPSAATEGQTDLTPILLAVLAGLVVLMFAGVAAFFWFRAQDEPSPPREPPTS